MRVLMDECKLKDGKLHEYTFAVLILVYYIMMNELAGLKDTNFARRKRR